jgi:hypothetical protein
MHLRIHDHLVSNRRTKLKALKRKRVPKPSPTPFSAPFVALKPRGAAENSARIVLFFAEVKAIGIIFCHLTTSPTTLSVMTAPR